MGILNSTIILCIKSRGEIIGGSVIMRRDAMPWRLYGIRRRINAAR
jgi:hypothetical protein